VLLQARAPLEPSGVVSTVYRQSPETPETADRMRRISQAKDLNHDAIVDEYRKQRCAVVSLARVGDGCPDLLVFGYGRLALVEVKQPKGKFKPIQEAFHKSWPVRVVRTREDVIQHVRELSK
jgi:predicted mannosyl-3-phosphoglycerate phosphatase (HAD superfamily)